MRSRSDSASDFESNRVANRLLHSAIRAVKWTVAASHRQKFGNDDEEKFDCDEHARRFDLIRSSQPLLLLRAAPHADEACSLSAMNCSCMSNNDPRRRP